MKGFYPRVCAKHVYVFLKQISKLTEKMKELTKCLSTEKETAEKSHKATSEQVSQQTSENRKMALEISKLKVTLITHLYLYTPMRAKY